VINGFNHKVEYWDSRLSGKKKLAVDGKVLILTKEMDNFYQNFKIGEYYCIVLQDEDQKPCLKINNRDFNDIMKDERTGKLEKERDKYAKNKKNDFKRINDNSESDYYKRALKYNGENYVEGTDGEIYDIEEQRRRLEEFEKKKEKENEEKNKKNKKNINNNEDNYNNKERKYLKFVLNNETVKKNQMIIQNINNIFDDDNLLDLNDIDFSQTNNNDNKGNYMGGNNFNNNNNYNFGQMNNNMNNNENNQNVFNQYLSNMENNNNNNFDFNQNFNKYNNNNYNNQNNINQNNNNNYNDDFNPFDD
jgi:hypothetical protein